jgi:hypothetical protein
LQSTFGCFFFAQNMTLAEYLTANLERQFEWGRNDCVLFVARWVEQATGVNHLADVPTWRSAKQALRIRRDLGGIEAVMDARFKRVNPHLANDGDIALYRKALCLFSGAQIVGPGHNGLVFINRMEVESAWSLCA